MLRTALKRFVCCSPKPAIVQMPCVTRAKSSVSSPLDDRYYLFNYFEKPQDAELFKSVWTEGSSHVVKQENFVATYLHHCNDPDIFYPWVNFALASSLDICFFGKRDDFWSNYIAGVVKHGFKASPAAFREIGSYNGIDLSTEDKERPKKHKFFITGVQAVPEISDQDIEGNWQEFCGSDMLHESGALEGSVVDTNLYKRVMMAPLFRYVARCEVTDVDDVTGHKIAKMLDSRKETPKGVKTISGFYEVKIPMKAR